MNIEAGDAFASRLARGDVAHNETHALSVPGVPESAERPLHVQVISALDAPRRAPLLVTFHGAINRKTRGYPYFLGSFVLSAARNYGATVLSISDPTLSVHPELTACWYQGAHDFPVPEMIRRFLDTLVSTLSPSRLIIFGGSVGGLPALLHGLDYPESVVVAQNPITSIPNYFDTHKDRYLKHCWPGVGNVQDLKDRIVLDVGARYAAGHRGTVIYIQNPTDHHFQSQAVHFMSQVKDVKRVLFVSQFLKEFQGHVAPRALAAEWIEAALAAEDIDRASIGACHEDLSAATRHAGQRSPKERPRSRGFEARTAQRLVAHARKTLEQEG